MSVYVDPLVQWGTVTSPKCFRTAPSCHMYADTLEQLHQMAAQIGMRRAWFQDDPRLPYYDLVASRRKSAVARGAIEHTHTQMARFYESVAKTQEVPQTK